MEEKKPTIFRDDMNIIFELLDNFSSMGLHQAKQEIEEYFKNKTDNEEQEQDEEREREPSFDYNDLD